MVRVRRRFGVALIALLTIGGLASSVHALTATYALSSSGGTGILVGNAVACPSVATCLAGTPDFSNASLALAGGSLSVVDSGTPGFPTGSLMLSIPTLTLTGGPLGGADEIVLTGLSASFTYGAFGLLESPVGGGLLSLTSLALPTATLTGSIESLLGGSSVSGPSAFSTVATLSALSCILAPGQCGVQLDFAHAGLEFRVTANLGATVPEPAAAALLAVAAMGLWRRRR